MKKRGRPRKDMGATSQNTLIERIEKNVERLESIGTKLVKSEYEKREFDDKIKEILGRQTAPEWGDGFKADFINKQEALGFEWTVTQGAGGPLRLESVRLPEEVGTELAKGEMDAGRQTGNFSKLIEDNLPKLKDYLSESDLLDNSSARAAFKDYSEQNQSFRFARGRGSQTFSLSVKEYSFEGKETGKSEKELGDRIESKLKVALDLDIVKHTQNNHKGSKFLNPDFEGVRIQRHLEGDRFLMYSFELKASNSVKSISEAISQAVNYRARSHFTYIIIPLFDQTSFHEPDRLGTFLDLCKKNGIGAISVDIDTKTHEVRDVIEVLSADENRLEDSSKLSELVDKSAWEFCPLCRRIVEVKNNEEGKEREGCGWQVSSGEGDQCCMKEMMEDRFMCLPSNEGQ